MRYRVAILDPPEDVPDTDLLKNVATAALPVKSFIKHFRDEFQHHIDHKRCLVPDYV